MSAIDSVPPSEYKADDFFPCISDEHRQMIRDSFFIQPEELEALENDEESCDVKNENEKESCDVKNDPFDKEKPVYERKNKRLCRSVHKGSKFDLMQYFQDKDATSLVRCLKTGDDGDVTFQAVDPVTSLKGKYVLLVCSFVPSKWSDSNGDQLCRLYVLSKEIASVDGFEILMVAKMRRGYESNLAAFSHFFSGFPNRLAISLDNPDLRDELCCNLDFHGDIKGILIDPEGKIVQGCLTFIEEYGAHAFPFTKKSRKAVLKEVMSLTSLLRCQPSTCLRKFGFPSESITVEQLSKKLVGLYLFRGGNKLEMLHEVYQLCKLRDEARGVEPQFEIVLFCLPDDAMDPDTYESEVYGLLSKLKPNIDASSWWVCPYDNSAGLRLLRVCRAFYPSDTDSLVSIGADGKFIDFSGGELLGSVGYEAYPFSLDLLLDRFVETAEQITLESLFTLDGLCITEFDKKDDSKIALDKLQCKNVLVYADSIPSSNPSTLDELIKWYPKVKEFDPDVEVVFVPYTGAAIGSVCAPESKSGIPWIRCPYHPDISASLRNHYAFYGLCDGSRIRRGLSAASVVVFGKGGHIHILDASVYLLHQGPDTNPFSPQSRNLRRDFYNQMYKDMDFVRELPSHRY